jgi:hypothetical protein
VAGGVKRKFGGNTTFRDGPIQASWPTGFRAFDKDAYCREGDLFDAAIYAVLVSPGDGTEARWSGLKRAPGDHMNSWISSSPLTTG